MSDDVRPYQRQHEHKWFMVNTKNAFETVSTNPTLYHMVEYAYLACFCGEVIKSIVKSKELGNDSL